MEVGNLVEVMQESGVERKEQTEKIGTENGQTLEKTTVFFFESFQLTIRLLHPAID